MIPQLQPLQPYNVMIRPLQPLGWRQPSYFNNAPNYVSNINDPFAVDSTVDVLFNRRGKERFIKEETGWDFGDIPGISDLAETVVSAFLYLNKSYAKPLLRGDLVTVAVNSLIDFSQTMDIAANATKALALGDDGGKTSLTIGAAVGALTAGAAVLTGGASLGAGVMAGFITSGISSIMAGIAQNPDEAFDRLNRSTGFSDYGRTQYDFDTGNFFANMYGEMTLDPLNWGSFGQSFLLKQAIRKGWKVPAKTFAGLTLLSDANDIVTKAAWSLNPLGASLKGVKEGFVNVMRFQSRYAIKQASEIVERGIKSVDDINKIQSSLMYAADEADALRRGYAATGELSRIRGKSRNVSLAMGNLANTLTKAGVPEAQVHNVIKNLMTSYLYGDLNSVFKAGGEWNVTPRAIANMLGEDTGTSLIKIPSEALAPLFESLEAGFGSYADALANNTKPILEAIETYADAAVRSSDFAHKVLSSTEGLFDYYSSKLADILANPKSWMGFNGNAKSLKAQALQYLFLKELPDMREFIKIDPLSKQQFLDYSAFLAKYEGSPAMRVFETLAKSQGVTLEDVFGFNGGFFDFSTSITDALNKYNDPTAQQTVVDIIGFSKGALSNSGDEAYKKGDSILNYVFGKVAGINKFYDAERSLKGPLNDALESFSEEHKGKLKNLFIDIANQLNYKMTSGDAPEIAQWANTLQTEHTSVLRFIDSLREELANQKLNLSDVVFKPGQDYRVASVIKSVFHPYLIDMGELEAKKFYKAMFSFTRFVEAFSHFDQASGRFKNLTYTFDDFTADMLAINTYGDTGKILMHLDAMPKTDNINGLMQFFKEFELVKPKFGIEEEVAASVGVRDNTFVMRLSKQMMTMQHFMNITEDKVLMGHIEDMLDPNNPLKQLMDDIASYPDNPYFDQLRGLAREILNSVEGYRNYATLLERIGNVLDDTIKFNPNADELAKMVDPAVIKIGRGGFLEIDPGIKTGEFLIDLAKLPYYNGPVTPDMIKADGTLDVTRYLHSVDQVSFMRGVYNGMFEDPEVKAYFPVAQRLKDIAKDVELGKALDVEADLSKLDKTIKDAKDILIKEQKRSAETVATQIENAKFEQLSLDLDTASNPEAIKIVETLLATPADELMDATGKTHLDILSGMEEHITELQSLLAGASTMAKETTTLANDLKTISIAVESLENLRNLSEHADRIIKEFKNYFEDNFYNNVQAAPIRLESFIDQTKTLITPELRHLGTSGAPQTQLKNFTFSPKAKGVFLTVQATKKPIKFNTVGQYANYRMAADLKLDPVAHMNTGIKVYNRSELSELGLEFNKLGVDTKRVHKPRDIQTHDVPSLILEYNELLEADQKRLDFLREHYFDSNVKAHDRAVWRAEMSNLQKRIYSTKQLLSRQGFGVVEANGQVYYLNKYAIETRIQMYERVALQEYFARNPEMIDTLLAQEAHSVTSPILEEMRMKLTTLFPTRYIDFKNPVPVRSHLVWDSEAINKLAYDTASGVTAEEMELFVETLISHSQSQTIKNIDMIFDTQVVRAHNDAFKFMERVVNKGTFRAVDPKVNLRLIGPDGRIFAGSEAFNEYRDFVRKARVDLESKYKGDISKLPEGAAYISFKPKVDPNAELVIRDLYTRFVQRPFTPADWHGKSTIEIKQLLANGGDTYVDMSAVDGYKPQVLDTFIKQAENNPGKLIYIGGNTDELSDLLKKRKTKLPDNLIFPEAVTPGRQYRFETFPQFKRRITQHLNKKYSLQVRADVASGETYYQMVTHKMNPETGVAELTRYGKLKESLERTTERYKSLATADANSPEFTTRNVFTTRYDAGVPDAYDTRFRTLADEMDTHFFQPDGRGAIFYSFSNEGMAYRVHSTINSDIDRLLIKFDDESFWDDVIRHRRRFNIQQQEPVAPNILDYTKFDSEEKALAYYMSDEYAATELQENINEILRQYKDDPETWLDRQTLNKISQEDLNEYINGLKPEKLSQKEALSLYKKSVRDYNKALKEYESLVKKYQKAQAQAQKTDLVQKSFGQIQRTPEEEAFIAQEKITVNAIRMKNNLYKQHLDAYIARANELGGADLTDATLRAYVGNIKLYFKELHIEISKIDKPGWVGGSEATQKARMVMHKARDNMDNFFEELRTEPLLREKQLRIDTGARFSNAYDPTRPAKTLEDLYQEQFNDRISKISRSEVASRYKNTYRNRTAQEVADDVLLAQTNADVDLDTPSSFLSNEYTFIKGSRGNEISSFSGKHHFLSNFSADVPVEYNGVWYPTSEHAYQAAKAVSPEDFEKILNAATPSEAKAIGQEVAIRPDWAQIQDQIMYDIVKAKFSHPSLKAKLLATGKADLIEGNPWGDKYWGVDLETNEGANKLGQVLMRIREEIRKDPNSMLLNIPYTQKTKLPDFMNPRELGGNLDTMSLKDIYTNAKQPMLDAANRFKSATGGLDEADPTARYGKLKELKEAATISEFFGKVAGHPLEEAPDPVKGYPLGKVPVVERSDLFQMSGGAVNPEALKPMSANSSSVELEASLLDVAKARENKVLTRVKFKVENLKPEVVKGGVTYASPEAVFTSFNANVSSEVLERFNTIEQLLKQALGRDDVTLYQNMAQDYAGYLPQPEMFIDHGDFLPSSPFLDSERLFITYLDSSNPDFVLAKASKDALPSKSASFMKRFLTQNENGYMVNIFYDDEYELLLLWLQRAIEKAGGAI